MMDKGHRKPADTNATVGADALSFAAAAREAGHRVAVVTDQGEWTFAELAPLVAQTKSWLRERISAPAPSSGGSTGPVTVPTVAVVGVSRLPQLIAIYALIDAGVPFLLVHPRWTAAERDARLEPFAPHLVIDSDWRMPLGDARDAAERAAAEPRVAEDSQTMAVVFTSGTTGPPKAAVLSRRSVLASASASAANLSWRDDDRWLLSLPVAHIGGLSVLTRTLIARRALVVTDDVGFGEAELIEAVEGKRVTLASLVPTQLHRLLKHAPCWDPPVSVRAILLGGAPASPSLLERARARGWPLLVTYGLTEACSQVATQRLSTLATGTGELEGVAEPLPGVELRIRPSSDGSRSSGAIEIRGPVLFDGYLCPSADGWRLDRGSFADGGWFETGDFGWLDADQRLHIADRGSERVISGGENISPSEVESVLERHPAIESACVFGVDDEEWGQRVAAALVPSRGSLPSGSELIAFLEPRIAGFKRPRLWAWLDSLPVAASGKVDRAAVMDRALEQGLEPLGQPPDSTLLRH